LKKEKNGIKKIIRIKTSLQESVKFNYAEISISNTGPNIPDENLNCIFDPFLTTKKPNEGSGLGLSIALTLIKNMRAIYRFKILKVELNLSSHCH
jgi:signal transduction histidine kinase